MHPKAPLLAPVCGSLAGCYSAKRASGWNTLAGKIGFGPAGTTLVFRLQQNLPCPGLRCAPPAIKKTQVNGPGFWASAGSLLLKDFDSPEQGQAAKEFHVVA